MNKKAKTDCITHVIYTFLIACILFLGVSLVNYLQGNGTTFAAAAKGSGEALVEQAEQYQGLTSLNAVKSAMKAKGYKLWREDYNSAWCAWFVSNCARHAGIPTSVIENNTYADREFYQKNNVYLKGKAYGGNYTPVAGDLIFFDWGGDNITDHIGIVRYAQNGTENISHYMLEPY